MKRDQVSSWREEEWVQCGHMLESFSSFLRTDPVASSNRLYTDLIKVQGKPFTNHLHIPV